MKNLSVLFLCLLLKFQVCAQEKRDNIWILGYNHDDAAPDDDALPPPEPAGDLHATAPLATDDFIALTRRLGVSGMDMDYEGTRFLLLNDQRQIVLAADYKLVLVAMPGVNLRRAHAFPRYGAEQVLGSLGADDPVDQPGGLAEGAAIAEALASRAGADLLYPDPLGPLFISLHDVRALASRVARPAGVHCANDHRGPWLHQHRATRRDSVQASSPQVPMTFNPPSASGA